MSKFHKALEIAEKSERHVAKKQETFESRVEVEQKVIPLKGAATKIRQELVVVNDPESELSEYFRFLRSWITRPPAGEPPKSILISSALMGEGKTFVAANLASSISQSMEDEALIVDADLRRPKIHKVFGTYSQTGGLSCLLSENGALSDFIEKTSIDKLSILPAGDCAKNPAELLSSDKMRKTIQEVRKQYSNHFMIIDSSPLEMTPETAVLSNFVDAVILVVRYAKTPRHCVRSALEKIPKEKFLGIVFNANEKEGRRRYGGYKYKYGYGKGSK